MFIERVKFIENELENIGATHFAQNLARKKGQILRFKISDLGVSAALILKQEAISVGADFIAPKHLILGEKGQYCGILLGTAQQMERIIKKCEMQPFGLKKVGEILSEHLDSVTRAKGAESSHFCHSKSYSCHSERSEESKKNNKLVILSDSEESQKKNSRDSSFRTSCFTQNDNLGRVSSVVSLPQNDKIKESQNLSENQTKIAESTTFCHSKSSSCHSERSEESQQTNLVILSEAKYLKNSQNRDSSFHTSCFTQNDNVGRDSSVVSLPQNDNLDSSPLAQNDQMKMAQNDNVRAWNDKLKETQNDNLFSISHNDKYMGVTLSQNQITYSEHPAFTYIATNKINTTLYIGVTNNLQKRIYEHKNHITDGFSDKYNCEKLVYFESFDNIEQAIEREKYLKGKKRDFKENLINSINPQWLDLYQYLFESCSTNCYSNQSERGNPLLCHSKSSSCHSERSEESQQTNLVILSEAKYLKNSQNRDSSFHTSCFTQNDNVGRDSSVVSLPQNDKIKESQNLGEKYYKTPQIMGIINITDDSFYANSRTQNIDEILQKIEAMIAQGVGIIDIGAASTRPDSAEVPSDIEMARLKEPLQAIFDAGLTKRAIFSLDSYNFECAKFALEKGFHIINDVYGLRDIRLAELAKNSDKKIVLMHNSWLFPHEKNIVKSVDEFFAQRLEMLEKIGIKSEQVILDVGFGFGKNSAENLRLTQNLAHFKHFGCAILMGASMKRTIGEVVGKDTDERLFGTLALHQIALDNGADIIRCHDFSAHIDMLKMWLALNERF